DTVQALRHPRPLYCSPGNMPEPSIHNSFLLLLFRHTNPRVLPPDLQVLVISTETDISPIAVTNLQGLVFGKVPRSGAADARACLLGLEVLDSAEGCQSAPPEVAI